MGRERFLGKDGGSITARIQSRMDQMRVRRQERTLSHEAGHGLPFAGQPETVKALFGDYGETATEIDLYTHPSWAEGDHTDTVERECADTRWITDVARHNDIYNQSVSTEEDSRLGVD